MKLITGQKCTYDSLKGVVVPEDNGGLPMNYTQAEVLRWIEPAKGEKEGLVGVLHQNGDMNIFNTWGLDKVETAVFTGAVGCDVLGDAMKNLVAYKKTCPQVDVDLFLVTDVRKRCCETNAKRREVLYFINLDY